MWLRSDVERKRLAGLAPLADSRAARPDGDLYAEAATEATYARLNALARQALTAGWPVIVDAAFLRRDQREAFRALAAPAVAKVRVPSVGTAGWGLTGEGRPVGGPATR